MWMLKFLPLPRKRHAIVMAVLILSLGAGGAEGRANAESSSLAPLPGYCMKAVAP